MSYSIVISSGDQEFSEILEERIKKIVQDSQEVCQIERHMSSSILDEKIRRYPADIYFFDLDMGLEGMQMAETLKKWNPDTNIIFVSERDDLVFQAIRCHPFRYIRKCRLEEELEEAVQAVLWKIGKEEKKFEITLKEGKVQLFNRQIVYIESEKHYVKIHSINQQYKLRGKLSDYEHRLKECGFVRIHVSYLVNMRYIHTMRTTDLMLDDGCVLPISRAKQYEVKPVYLDYIQNSVYGKNVYV